MRTTFPVHPILYFELLIYGVITNDVSNYINLLVRIAHIICNSHIYKMKIFIM